MNQQLQAMQQALEALEPYKSTATRHYTKIDSAIDSLRIAIADAEKQNAESLFKFMINDNEVLRLDEQGFHYKGDVVHDAGIAYRLFVEWMKEAKQAEKQEPVARFNWNEAKFEWLTEYSYEKHHMKPLYLAPPMSIKPENIDTKVERVDPVNIKPVAWMHVQGNYEEPSLYELDDEFLMRGWDQFPLYAAPPKREWEGLTHGELAECQSDNPYQFYRGIEQRLKEKNHDSTLL
jgi:hypothetical protein